MLTLSDGDFNRLYTYIQQRYGINLSHKKQLVQHNRNHLRIFAGDDLIYVF